MPPKKKRGVTFRSPRGKPAPTQGAAGTVSQLPTPALLEALQRADDGSQDVGATQVDTGAMLYSAGVSREVSVDGGDTTRDPSPVQAHRVASSSVVAPRLRLAIPSRRGMRGGLASSGSQLVGPTPFGSQLEDGVPATPPDVETMSQFTPGAGPSATGTPTGTPSAMKPSGVFPASLPMALGGNLRSGSPSPCQAGAPSLSPSLVQPAPPSQQELKRRQSRTASLLELAGSASLVRPRSGAVSRSSHEEQQQQQQHQHASFSSNTQNTSSASQVAADELATLEPHVRRLRTEVPAFLVDSYMRMARLGVPSEYCRTAALFTHFLDFVNPLTGAAAMDGDEDQAGASSGPSPDAKAAPQRR